MPEMLILSLEPSTPLPERISAIFKGAIARFSLSKSRSLANGCWTARQDWVSMRVGPHSLGKPIEWKPSRERMLPGTKEKVPTRWGNQLNGN